jgi:hypothetical protein
MSERHPELRTMAIIQEISDERHRQIREDWDLYYELLKKQECHTRWR